MSLGVLVGDLLISVIGSGWWQITLVVTLAVAAAVFANGGTLLVNQAGASAVLVATLLPPGQAGGLDRCVDALIGGLRRGARGGRDPVGPGRPGRAGPPGRCSTSWPRCCAESPTRCATATPTPPWPRCSAPGAPSR